MPRKEKDSCATGGCLPPDAAEAIAGTGDCCRVEAIVGVDERGQMVLPKELRMRAGIEPGQRLAVTSWTRGGKVCCLTLTPVDDLAGLIKDHLGPLMKNLLQP